MSDVRGVRRVWCVAGVTCGCVEEGLWSLRVVLQHHPEHHLQQPSLQQRPGPVETQYPVSISSCTLKTTTRAHLCERPL